MNDDVTIQTQNKIAKPTNNDGACNNDAATADINNGNQNSTSSVNNEEGTAHQDSSSKENQDGVPGEDDSREQLSKFFKMLGISGNQTEETHEKVISTLTIEGIAEYINSEKCKNIIVMSGAGISTAAGIPDFRSPGTGLYSKLEKYNLPHPQAIFELEYFKENPQPFFMLAKELYPGNFKPTTSHFFIKLLSEKGLLLRTYTQNIDGLEYVAGVEEEQVIAAHGTFITSHCVSCEKEYNESWMKEKIFASEIPKCEECQQVVKPDIVFFGENLPLRFFRHMGQDFRKADLLVVMGTSLTVQPFASLINRVGDHVPRLLINKEKCGQSFFSGGFDFDGPNNYRDVALLGSCDQGCIKLAQLLGWKDDLAKLINGITTETRQDSSSSEEAPLQMPPPPIIVEETSSSNDYVKMDGFN